MDALCSVLVVHFALQQAQIFAYRVSSCQDGQEDSSPRRVAKVVFSAVLPVEQQVHFVVVRVVCSLPANSSPTLRSVVLGDLGHPVANGTARWFELPLVADPKVCSFSIRVFFASHSIHVCGGVLLMFRISFEVCAQSETRADKWLTVRSLSFFTTLIKETTKSFEIENVLQAGRGGGLV